jgi:RHS repeat-associated protein
MPTIDFLWDEWSDNVLQETDENNVVTTYFQRPEKYGEVLYHKAGSRFSFYHFDGNGSTRKLTNVSQSTIKTSIFSGFGELVASSGTGSTPFAYKGAAGYYTNPVTNDIYVRARTYEPATGRWLSKDPLGFIDGPNLYGAYFVPNGSDPSGLVEIERTGRRVEPTCQDIHGRQSYKYSLSTRKWPCRTEEGIYVQLVRVKCKLTGCTDADPFRYHWYQYWEAWPATIRNRNVIDKAEFFTKDKRLSYRQYGTVKFFCIGPRDAPLVSGEISPTDLSWQPSGEVGPADCSTTSGGLGRVLTRPSWWANESADGKTGHRRFLMAWNCCCDETLQFPELQTEP